MLSNLLSLSLALLAFVAALLISYFGQRKSTKNDLPYPPGPKPRFFWGNALDFPDVRKGYNLSPLLWKWMQQYGSTITVHIPLMGPMIFTSDPELIHYITVKKNFPKSPTYAGLMNLFGEESIVLSSTNINPAHDNKAWMKKRRIMNPGFTDVFLKSMVGVMCEKMERLTARLDEDAKDKGKITHTLSEMQSVTADIIAQIAFGEDWGPPNENPGLDYLREMQDILAISNNDPFEKMFGFRKKLRVKKLRILMEEIFTVLVKKRLDEISHDNEENNENNNQSILSIMVKNIQKLKKGAEKKEVLKEDMTNIIHQMRTLFFAGHDTTATTISFALWLLSQNPEALEKLRMELRSKNFWQNGNKDLPTYDMLQDCKYLDAVINESLRLYPPAGTARYTKNTTEQYQGYNISNVVLVVDHYCLHRNPQYYDSPHDFKPERFIDGKGVKAGASEFPTFIPFSKGPRDCVGKYFALLEAKVVLSRLVLRYDFECVEPDDGFGYRITAQPRLGSKLNFSIHKER